MEEYSTLIQTVALTMGVAWASGINLYGTLLALGIMSNTGYVDLPADLQIVGDPLVIAAAGLMYGVEFFADKIPGVDTGWDTLHTFVPGSRVMINTSPEPVSNWAASITEDVAVFTGLWAAIAHPYFFIALLVAFILLMIWLMPKLWRGIKRVWQFFTNLFSGGSSNTPDSNLPVSK